MLSADRSTYSNEMITSILNLYQNDEGNKTEIEKFHISLSMCNEIMANRMPVYVSRLQWRFYNVV